MGPKTFLALILAGVLALAYGTHELHAYGASQRTAGYQQRVNEDEEAIRKKSEANKAESEQRKKDDQNAKLEHEQTVAHLAADRDRALSELGRLRQRLASARSAGAAASGATQTVGGIDDARAAGLLPECAARFEGMAAEAGRLAGKVNGLQSAIRATCPEVVDDVGKAFDEKAKLPKR